MDHRAASDGGAGVVVAWIESHQELREHPKTKRFARRLGCSRPQAIGHLHLLWWWALDYAQDGDLSSFDPEDVADAALWDGDASLLWAALSESGFVDSTGRIHDWDDYALKLIERRQANAERMRKARAAHKDTPIKERASHVRSTSRARVERQYPTVPDRTVPDRTGPPEIEPVPGPGASARAREDSAASAAAVAGAPAPPESKPIAHVSATTRADPKPNRIGQVVELLQTAGVQVPLAPRDTSAIKHCNSPPALISEAYLAAWRGDWPPGDDWLREHLSLHAVIDRIGGYQAWVASGGTEAGGGTAQSRRNGRGAYRPRQF